MKEETKNKLHEMHQKYGDIEIKCAGSGLLPIDRILEFQGDLKKLPEKNMLRLAKSMFVNKFISPFFLWDDGGDWKNLDGHQRLKTLCAIREAGIPIPVSFPYSEIEATSEADARQKLLAVTSQYGVFQKEVLDEWIAEIDPEIADVFALVDGEIELSIASLDDDDGETSGDDDSPEVGRIITESGDLWELWSDKSGGKHRLLCGDATKPEDVKKLCPEPVDLYLTDPPYNVAYEGKTKEALKIQNDSMEDTAFLAFLTDSFTAADSVMKPGAAVYVWHADSEGLNFRQACKNAGWGVRQCLIWMKNTMVMGRQDYQWRHEPCLYSWKPGAGHLWNSDRKQTTILEFNKPNRSDIHPTMKPVELFEYCLRNNTKEQDIVLDSFFVSGTTLIASEKSGRISRGLELDPRYASADIIRFINWCNENDRACFLTKNGEEVDAQALLMDNLETRN